MTLKTLRLMALPILAGTGSFIATAGVYHTKFDSPLGIGGSARGMVPGAFVKLFQASVICNESLERRVELKAVDQQDARDTIRLRLPTCAIEDLSSGIVIRYRR